MVQQCYQHWQSIFDHILPFLPEHVVKPLKMPCTNLQMRWSLCVFIIPAQPQKRTYNVTPALLAVSFPSIPTKKSRVTALLMPIISKAEKFISRAIAGNSCSIPSNARPLQVDYQLWVIFGNPTSTPYLKNIATREKYTRLVKYFHGQLILSVYGRYLPKIIAIFCTTLPTWHNSANFEVQDDMEK